MNCSIRSHIVLAALAVFTAGIVGCAAGPSSEQKTYRHQIFDGRGDRAEEVARTPADSAVTHVDDIIGVDRFVSYGAGSFAAVRTVDGQPTVYKLTSLDPCGQVYIVTDVPADQPCWAQQRYERAPNERHDTATTMLHVHALDEAFGPKTTPIVPTAPSSSLSYPSTTY